MRANSQLSSSGRRALKPRASGNSLSSGIAKPSYHKQLQLPVKKRYGATAAQCTALQQMAKHGPPPSPASDVVPSASSEPSPSFLGPIDLDGEPPSPMRLSDILMSRDVTETVLESGGPPPTELSSHEQPLCIEVEDANAFGGASACAARAAAASMRMVATLREQYGAAIDAHLRRLQDGSHAASPSSSHAASLAHPVTRATKGGAPFLSAASQLNAVNDKDRHDLISFYVQMSRAWEGNDGVLSTATVHLATSLFDRYVELMPVKRERLAVVGAAALFIASKVEDTYSLNSAEVRREFSTRSATLCMELSATELEAEEARIIERLEWGFNVPTAHTFLLIDPLALGLRDAQQRSYAEYLVELALLDRRSFVNFKPSTVAAAAARLAIRATALADSPDVAAAASASDHPKRELQACTARLYGVALKASTQREERRSIYAATTSKRDADRFKAVTEKYSCAASENVRRLKWERVAHIQPRFHGCAPPQF